jgi:hypothetical protein
MSELVKRLRSKHCCDATKCNCDEAADRITALEAENKALREALRPFAELGDAWVAADEHDNSIWVTSPDSMPVNNLTNFGFTFGHFRAAARALLANGEK